MSDVSPAELLGEQGPLAQSIQGFAAREPQQVMADAVWDSLDSQQTLVVEAGTGVGKTYAYLVPALMGNGKVIISTGTRTLQDQLFHRDLPTVQKHLGTNASTALLKGRANYLCLHRLKQADGQVRQKQQISALQEVKFWSKLTKSGDIAELSTIAEDAQIWPKVTSTVDNCLGSQCSDFNDCYVVKARRQAQEADVVVVNHHLFLADMALKEEGFGEVLPSANAFVIDEAHQIPEIATRFFGQTISSRQLLDLCQDAIATQLDLAPDATELREQAQAIEQQARQFRLALGHADKRTAWATMCAKPDIQKTLSDLITELNILKDLLTPLADYSEEFENILKRCEITRSRLQQYGQDEDNHIYWFEAFASGFALYATPLDIAGPFNQYMQRFQASWVFTSATLAVGEAFEHFTERLGLEHANTQQLNSPFDYENNALLYLPNDMPQPNEQYFTQAVIDAALPVLKATQGRAFLLFTSHRALRYAAKLLEEQIDFPLFVQGDSPRSQLLDQFRTSGNGVLLGTSSFWEGVDIKGEALSCVIIDKLPFAAPSDPVLQARLTAIKKQGGEPFMEHQLPQAIIALKQGVGRLIRDVNDKGVLMICDPRLKTKPYGRLFLASLPPMPVTQRLADVEEFFEISAECVV